MRVKYRPNLPCMLLLLACATGLVGVAFSPAAAQVPGEPPSALVKTTVLPGETDLDKVYAREKNANKKAAQKAADRQKYGIPEKPGEKGHVKKVK